MVCSLVLPAAAFVAIACKANPAARDAEPFLKFRGQGKAVQAGIVKINDFTAGNAVKMVVGCPVRVKPSRVSVAFHYPYHICLGKGDQGPVHRIQADIGKFLF